MEKQVKITFSISLISILLLLFIANQVEPKLYQIEEIETTMTNQHVKIIGEIINIRDMKGFQIIIVKDNTGTIDVLTNSKEPIEETENNVVVIGKITEYNGEPQISANEIIEILD